VNGHLPPALKLLILVAILGSISESALALPLPYSARTKSYSGYSTTIRGDNDTVGMSGATVAVPNSVSNLESNPAGLTMTMGSVTAQINSGEVEDNTITGSNTKLQDSQWGLTVTPGNWGYSVAYYSPAFEGGSYTSPNTGQASEYEASLKQVRFAVSHLVTKRLSVGFGLDFYRAIRNVGEDKYSSMDLNYKIGAIYHVGNHILVAATFSPEQEIGNSVFSSGAAEMPGFAKPIMIPLVLTTGVGWIPNRFFTAGFALSAVGATKNTALLRDENISVGNRLTLQPKIGASYVLGQYDHLKIQVSVGSYYETSRVDGESNRFHGTGSLSVNPYFANLGIGIDKAVKYNNFFVSIGVDIVRLVRTFDIIPPDPVPALGGFYPKPFEISADGLPEPLTRDEEKEFAAPSASDVTDIIKNVPKNIENKFEGKPSVQEQKQKEDELRAAKRKKRRKKRPVTQPSDVPAPQSSGLPH
jgi:hypothetical protein